MLGSLDSLNQVLRRPFAQLATAEAVADLRKS
jgi:hypothetical protein